MGRNDPWSLPDERWYKEHGAKLPALSLVTWLVGVKPSYLDLEYGLYMDLKKAFGEVPEYLHPAVWRVLSERAHKLRWG